MTDQPPRRTVPAKTTAGIAAIALAVAAVVPLTTSKEGVVTKPYYDPVHVRTVCIGETQGIQDRLYTRDECKAMLQSRMTKDYAPGVLNCVPTLVENKPAFAALIDFAYNAGVVRACRSPMAAAFNARQWAKGCDAFRGYVVTARGVKLPGLVKRREDERALCMRGVG